MKNTSEVSFVLMVRAFKIYRLLLMVRGPHPRFPAASDSPEGHYGGASRDLKPNKAIFRRSKATCEYGKARPRPNSRGDAAGKAGGENREENLTARRLRRSTSKSAG